ncbi:hypothetical protein BVRB_023670, partial [Beta vulgaris subsp. vulgaris]
ITRYKAK